MEFRLLGPVELRAGERRYDLPPTEACLLACLAEAPGRLVSTDTLIDRLWGVERPPGAQSTLQAHASRLRRRLREAFGDEVSMPRAERGYVLQVDEEAVDLNRFHDLWTKGRAMADSGDYPEAAQLYREAENLWRGEPLTGLPGDWAARRRAALVEEHKAFTFDRIDVELSLRRHNDLIGELYELVRRHPFAEKPVEQLMLALYRSRRVPEASEVYRQAWRRFADAGVPLTAELQDLHQRILRGDPELAAPPVPGLAFRPATPNLLRRDIPEFTGRAEEVQQVLDAVGARLRGAAVPVVALHGMPGVGKTAFAVHVAHRLVENYPDAQLFLDLHAHHPIQDPLDPGTALGILLRFIGVPAEQIPHTLDERAAFWCARLANRRVLLVLDDAADVEQVRPLLPGTPECLVLITSRRRLTGLSGVLPISLDVLHPDDAAELLRRVVGPGRALDAEDVAEVVRLCGYWPLGIHIAGGQFRERRSWSINDLRERLTRDPYRPGRTRLDSRRVTETFEPSYQDLSTGEQRMFRRLGLFPGSEFSTYAAAALAGTAPADGERLLDELYGSCLVEELAPGRYRLHDLLRDYAGDLSLRDDHEPDRRLALHRLLDYYLRAADRADRVLYAHRRRIDIDPENPPVELPPLRTREEAQGWLDTERGNVLSLALHAADYGWPRHGALLPHLLAGYLETQGYWSDAITAHGRAIDLWHNLGDRTGQARALMELCVACARVGDYGDSLHHAERALALCRDIGDRWGEGEALSHVGIAHWNRGRNSQALRNYSDALAIRRHVGDRTGEADTLNHIGMVYLHTGRYAEANEYFLESLAIYRDIRDQRGVANQLNNIGDVEQHLGRYDDALDRYQKVLVIVRAVGIPQAEAVLLNNIGNVLRSTGSHAEALGKYREALSIYRAIGDSGGEAEALVGIGLSYDRTGRHREALIHHQKAFAVSREIGETHTQAEAILGIGEAYLGLQRYALASDHDRAAVTLARAIGDPHQEGRALRDIGYALLHTQGQTAAEPYLRQAVALFDRLGVPDAEPVRSRLQTLDATGS